MKGDIFLSHIELIYNTLTEFNFISILFRILLATIVGGFIGFERSRSGHAAGLRTHVIVSTGSSLTVLIGLYSTLELGFYNDPLRVSAQVISGIGFLGAGQIICRGRTQIIGLTTAAGLWTTASIGIAIGLGFYWAAFIALIAIKITSALFPYIEHHFQEATLKRLYFELENVNQVNTFFKDIHKDSIDFEITTAKSGLSGHIGLTCVLDNSSESDLIKKQIEQLPYVVFTALVL